MGDESLFASMALPVILIPILEKLEQHDLAAAESLRSAFTKADMQHPGLIYDLIKGVLRRAQVEDRVNMTECLLRLEASNNSAAYEIPRPDEPFQNLNMRANNLKKILSRIPDEIYDRKKFLETIKDIASAIKYLLDAVNQVVALMSSSKQALELRKREFVKYSKRFSTTLKDFFKENVKQDVFNSANHLINQTNMIMKTVIDAC
ncbi:Programmed cell death protein 10-A [Lamellibrachia satsuma]|nr:Programmed cell death protein 10-A [Lamellibrachia satsuma]